MPTFEPPVVFDRSPVYVAGQDPLYPARPFRRAQRLMSHYGGQPRGRSVLKIGGAYQTVDVPTVGQIESASEVYLGGHIYTVDAPTAAALTAAGYTVT